MEYFYEIERDYPQDLQEALPVPWGGSRAIETVLWLQLFDRDSFVLNWAQRINLWEGL